MWKTATYFCRQKDEFGNLSKLSADFGTGAESTLIEALTVAVTVRRGQMIVQY